MVTQKHIAQQLGISQSAVASAFHPTLQRYVSPSKRQQIFDTARNLGYVPHQAGRRLARTRADRHSTSFDLAGLIYLTPAENSVDPVLHAMMNGIEREVSKQNASLIFVRVSEPTDWRKVEQLTRGGGLDGWLIYGVVTAEAVDRLQAGKLPYVILGDHTCAPTVHSVNVDNVAVGRMAVEHLAALGHRRIGFLGVSMSFAYRRQTLAGLRAGVKELGLDDDDRLITESASTWGKSSSAWDSRFAESLMDWLRKADPMPTALFTPEFDGADATCRVLTQSQIAVPRKMSIVGCESFSPAVRQQNFTRIDLPLDEVGRQGALLLHRLALHTPAEAGELKISPSLIEGWSTSRK